MEKFIFTGFSPNTRADDAWLAAKLVFFRLLGRSSNSVPRLEHWFQEYYQTKYAIAVDSGRSALQLALAAGGVGEGDEVILQAFTCVVVANSITNLKAKPVYVDCNSDYTLDHNRLTAAITPKTKALIVQHTFGAPAAIEEIVAIAKSHNLLVIEDCAHALGGSVHGKLLGTFGDLAMFSFGSDKVISGVRGGMIITNNPVYGQKLRNEQSHLPLFPLTKELPHLFHPIYFYFGKKTYHWGLGKIKLFAAQKLGLINRIIDQAEKQGRVPVYFPAQLPDSLATLALNQIKHLDTWNQQRQHNVQYYLNALQNKKSIQSLGTGEMWLRFPVLVSNPQELCARAKKRHIILGDWYQTPLAPADANPVAAEYQAGSCPVAEKLGKQIVNLPTDPQLTTADLDRIVAIFT